MKEASRKGLLTENELIALEASLKEVQDWSLVHSYSGRSLQEALRQLWDSVVAPSETVAGLEQFARTQPQRRGALRSVGLGWTFAMSPAFVKAVKSVDKTIQGRILEAMRKLWESPVEVVGDTVKPLTGNLAGLWRYRIGDYRLIYEPDMKKRLVVLLSFEARESAYD
jgi:mRNA-degrading endonuclease RelE of RelBE toxin-antitoxin system